MNLKLEIKDELIEVIQQSFKTEPGPKKSKPCRIKFLGKFITVSSKKTVWRNRGFAKSALLNHFVSSREINKFLKILLKKEPYEYIDSELIKNMIKTFEQNGQIEYVEVDFESLAILS